MIEKFELLLDLLNIESGDVYMNIAKQIESRKYKNIKTSCKHGFVFEIFNDFVGGNISLEDFLLIGDVESKIDILQNGFDINCLMDKDYDLNDTLFIVSAVDIGRKFSKKQIGEIEKRLTTIGSLLFVI